MESYRIRIVSAEAAPTTIEMVREFMGVGLRRAREVVQTNGVLLEYSTAAEARRIVARFAEIDVQIEVEPTSRPRYAYAPEHAERGDQRIARLRVDGRDVAVDEGQLGRWEVDSLDAHLASLAKGRGQTHGSEDAARAHGSLVEAGWRREGLALVDSEIAIVEACSAREPALEDALREQPEDAQVHLVYGDWLQRQGDVRGQLVALQCEAARDPEGPSAAAEQALRRDHASHLFGPLSTVAERVIESWSRGFVDAAFVGAESWSRATGGPLEVLDALLRLPVCARLQSLGLTKALAEHPELPATLMASPVAAQLRHLELGDRPDHPRQRAQRLPEDRQATWEALWPHLSGLEQLTVRGYHPGLERMGRRALTRLDLHLGRVTGSRPWSTDSPWLRADFSALEVLSLHLSGRSITAAMAQAVFIRVPPVVPTLEVHLNNPEAELGGMIDAFLLHTGLDASVRTLDLRGAPFARDLHRAIPSFPEILYAAEPE